MRRLFVPSARPLINPGTGGRVLRRPDFRAVWDARLSGAPLSDAERDHDDLVVHRSWREYDPDRPDAVKYLMYHVSQRDADQAEFDSFFKAVRLIRLTRVPRYLRQGTGQNGANAVFEQQRDVLAALREKQVLFLNVIAKAPTLPLVFAYGVQAVGATPEEARRAADESYAVLDMQLSGTYQQLEYAPLTVLEGETLARYQLEWEHVAVGRGRPLPTGNTIGGAALLDGNRTDLESTNNQLESFIRGMSDRSFMLSLITTPVSPADMAAAWSNLTRTLSTVRSEQEGSRSVTAGVALPLAFGASDGLTHGNSHGTTATDGTGTNEGVSNSLADSVTHSDSTGTSRTDTSGLTSGTSQSQALGATTSAADSVTSSVAAGQSTTLTDSTGASHTATEGVNASHSVGSSQGVTQTDSSSSTNTVSTGQSVAHGTTSSSNWANTSGSSWSNTSGTSDSVSSSTTSGTSQSTSTGASSTDTHGISNSDATSSGNSTGIPGISVNDGTTNTAGSSHSNANSNSVGASSGTSSSSTSSADHSHSSSSTSGGSSSSTSGGSQATSTTNSSSVGQSQAVSTGQSLATSLTSSSTETAGTSSSVAQSVSTGQSLAQGASSTQTAGAGRTVGTAESVTNTGSASQSASQSVADGVSRTASDGSGRTVTQGSSLGTSTSKSLSDAYQVAMTRASAQTASLGLAPSLGVSLSRRTFDESKRALGDILEAQSRRYLEGVESGAFFYQMFLIAPDRQTLVGGSGLLKSAFWGPGGANARLAMPFHTIDDFDSDVERQRLLAHAAAFTSYRRREPTVEYIEPYLYSSYVTPGEAAAFCHPPTAEALGIQAVVDSMPVMAMPYHRSDRDITLGHIINGERAKVTDTRFGFDVDEVTHTLVAGITGTGKTTTVMRMLTEIAKVRREVAPGIVPGKLPTPPRTVQAGILALDWMRNMRHLGSVVEPDRFRFYSVTRPDLGEFRWNPLAIPDESMAAGDWLATLADNMMAAWGLGQFGRSLVAEYLQELYSANRLQPFVLRPEVRDADGNLLRAADVLPPVDRASLPASAVRVGLDGQEYANVFTYPALSRLVSLSHFATMVAAQVEFYGTPEGAKSGMAMRDRIQTLWRRCQPYAPGNQYDRLVAADPSLEERTTLGVRDLVDPDAGLVVVVETDGMDLPNRRLILGAVMLAIYRYGLHVGDGVFNHAGKGPGTFIVLEEAHEILGAQGDGEDRESAAQRVELYASMHRRARALGIRLVDVVQNPGSIDDAITSNTSTVLTHRVTAKRDKDAMGALLNWNNQVGQQQREYRYLGEMPRGYVIARLDARDSWLESAPVLMLTDPPALGEVSDEQLRALARQRAA